MFRLKLVAEGAQGKVRAEEAEHMTAARGERRMPMTRREQEAARGVKEAVAAVIAPRSLQRLNAAVQAAVQMLQAI